MTTFPQPPGSPHHALCPRRRACSYRLLSATTTIFPVRSFRHTSATTVCPRYLVFTLCQHVFHAADDQLYLATSSGAHIVHTARVRSPLTDDVVPLGTAVGTLGAARIKTRVRTLLYVFQRVLGEAPPRRRTNVGCLTKIRTRSQLIYEEVVYSTPKFCTCTDFFNKHFLGKV